jgi:2,4-dienoyl-CoA reductase-like NADH-dependent reductase (Old Yellow Enzyme family)
MPMSAPVHGEVFRLPARPGKLGSLRFENRVIMASMHTNCETTDGYSTEYDRHYDAERAKGGVAMTATDVRKHNKIAVHLSRPLYPRSLLCQPLKISFSSGEA